MNTESVQHTTVANYMVNMWLMFPMNNTLPGNYVKHVSKSPTFFYFTRVSEHVDHVYHFQHTTWNLCETCLKCTQLCRFNKRPEPLVCILLRLSSALQKILFNQFGVAKFRIQLHPWLPLRVVISYLRYWWWPLALIQNFASWDWSGCYFLGVYFWGQIWLGFF